MNRPPPATATQAILAVSRLLGDTAATTGPDGLRAALVREARALFDVDAALLLALDAREEVLTVLALEPAAGPLPAAAPPVADVPAIRDLLALRLPAAHGTLEATQTGAGLPGEWPSGTTLFIPIRDRHSVRHVLALGSDRPRPFTADEQQLGEAFAAAAAGALAQLRLAEEQGRRVAQHEALARAARTLTENLDITRLLTDICAQSQAILEADCSAIYLGDDEGAMVAEAVYDLDTRVVGYRMSSGEGLAGRVVETGTSQMANDYRGTIDHPPSSRSPRSRQRSRCPCAGTGPCAECSPSATAGRTRPALMTCGCSRRSPSSRRRPAATPTRPPVWRSRRAPTR